MNTILLVTTISAVIVALGALAAVFVSRREERLRSDARIAALRRLAVAKTVEDVTVAPIDVDDLATYDDDGSAVRPMFSNAPEASPWGRRLAAAAVMAVIVSAAGYVLLPRGSSAAPAAPTASATRTPPLELLSLRQSQEEGRLVITGLVQNPRTGVTLTRVIATAFLFSADGTFLASARAPLDFATLAAGDESPFVLTVPVSVPVARYRVGFRGEDGRVIAHVDRRAAGTLARTTE